MLKKKLMQKRLAVSGPDERLDVLFESFTETALKGRSGEDIE
jgi:hypothetical protein